ncbi:DUF1902 domain-containing protein [Nitrosomonas communis]|jgi:hypothetical protein|uniref:DUF1902 domain-containing protein n=1 Tax=Nitrosomonas communis TaxID=44574 RepID=A0A1I4WZ41_9PROT|nr:DUF1902 domain-containing protein [Nitrosomonas communis]SFN18837.1 protein of unknown function [Nitrosomonas communis]
MNTSFFIAKVSNDSECGMLIAICDELGLATESKTYEGLTERVWEIAPEIAAENGIDISIETIISFQQNQTAKDRGSMLCKGSSVYPKLRTILHENGCMFVRHGKYSHAIWAYPPFDKYFTVPVTIISRVLANAILEQADVKQNI